MASNQLDDSDLIKICEVLEGDSKIQKIIIGNNMFTDPMPLIELLRHNGRYLTYLDISGVPLEGNSLKEMATTVLNLSAIEDLSICGCFTNESTP